ncbi:Metal transporter Nramp3.2-like protein [Drosera capensis]
MFGETKPDGKELIIGILVPKLSSGTIQQAVAVVGCIIMPHNVFLHSALVQSRDIDHRKRGQVQEAINYYSIETTAALVFSFVINLFVTAVFGKVFYGTTEADSIGLVNVVYYLQEKFGGGFIPILYIWGIGLLAGGQSNTITGTYAEQFIMGGFLNLRIKKRPRSLFTRSCAIIPTIIVALMFDTSDGKLDVLNEWLDVLQSLQTPFALIPLLCLVSKEEITGVFKINTVLKTAAWVVATLVIVINGYLFYEFFSSEVKGVVFASTIFIFTAAYIAFVPYLVSRTITFPSWFRSWKTKLSLPTSKSNSVASVELTSSLIERLEEAFLQLEAHNSNSADDVQCSDIQEHFRELDSILKKKLEELGAKEKELAEKETETRRILAESEAAIVAKEQDMLDRVQALKDAAVAAILEARAIHMSDPVELSSNIWDVTEYKMDAKGLLKFTMENVDNRSAIRKELTLALTSASEPARLVLDSLEGFFPSIKISHVGKNKDDAALKGMRSSCLIFLEALATLLAKAHPGVVSLLTPETEQLAKAIAAQWKLNLPTERTGVAKGSSLEVEAFLRLLATFRITPEFGDEELCELVLMVAHKRQAPELCRSLGLTHKVQGIINTLINSDRQVDAVHFIHAFELFESYPPIPLLKTYLKDLRRNSQGGSGGGARARKAARELELSAVRAVIGCIKEYKLESGYPLDPLERRFSQLANAKSGVKKNSDTGNYPPLKKQKPNGESNDYKPHSGYVDRGSSHDRGGATSGGRQPPSQPHYERAPNAGVPDRYSHLAAPTSYGYGLATVYPPGTADHRSYYYPHEDQTAAPYNAAVPNYGSYVGGVQPSHQAYMWIMDTRPPTYQPTQGSASRRFVSQESSIGRPHGRQHPDIDAHVKHLVNDLKSSSVQVQREAAAGLRVLSRHDPEKRIAIAENGAISPLVDLLKSTDSMCQENAVTALLNLSINDNNKAAIAHAGAIEPLIHVLGNGSPEVRQNAAATLFSLSLMEEIKLKIGRSGAILPLVELLDNGTPRGKKDAVTALYNLSTAQENRIKIVQVGAVKRLIKLMDPATGLGDKAVTAVLANLAATPEGCFEIGREGGVILLVDVVELGSAKGKECAAAALLQLCISSDKHCHIVLIEGIVPLLFVLAMTGTPRAKDKARQLLTYLRNYQRAVAQAGPGRG